ncbi:HD domain-containing protein [Timonella sp. A28]|uniref:[protein-PII] uridylyltransferase family protein n=1 Tax=Timonella sp. A28 TaxID=3442640 RepID=UPI003EB6F432
MTENTRITHTRNTSIELLTTHRKNLHTLTSTATPSGDTRNAITTSVVQAIHQLWDNTITGLQLPPTAHDRIVLAGVGSLGRGDMGLHSDIDLVLIHDTHGISTEAITQLAENLWYPLWDAGIELDHSVRSLSQCRTVATHDIAAAVGLLSIRPIAGNAALAYTASHGVLTDWRAASRRRLPELIHSAQQRSQQHGELAYHSEPDLKECRGGLRDATLLDALAATWIVDKPHGAVDTAVDTLLNARDALHCVAGRNTNRLLVTYLDEVADRCGWNDGDEFLTNLAQAGRVISYALDTTIRRAKSALAKPQGQGRTLVVRGRRTAPRLRTVAEGIVEHDGELVLTTDTRTRNDSVLPFRMAATAAHTGLPISPSALPTLAACPRIAHPWPQQARAAFLHVLGAGVAQIPVWESLDQGEIITQWIPEWHAVRNRPQRSHIHRHTVDRHLIEVVSRMRPWLKQVQDPTIMLLAAFFHDIGKQKDVTDHSEYGASRIPDVLAPMGWTPTVTRDVMLLVRHHLLLSRLATQEDNADPKTVEKLVAAVDNRADLLTALRALTEADAASLATSQWTNWRAGLVDTLYRKALSQIRST